ncbi:hypothetical protein [Streptomyces sp. CBMA29]|uniref:hypothetical protein n=1 Tax=Streptomyces sp. CBMA29 TaxID=1896314 RepID=UPI0016621171|nr:hypothetical protein [Streptomyces sp. CBMA29]MBD0739863.1 hypothetical protein [Streptomyces sp. CBMA29]
MLPPYLVVLDDHDARPGYSDKHVSRMVKGLIGSRYVDTSHLRVYVVGNLIDITGQYVFQEDV